MRPTPTATIERPVTAPRPTPIREIIEPRRQLTEAEQRAVQEVHDLAMEFASLPAVRRPAFLHEVRKLTSGRQRFVATAHTPPEHPAFRPLMQLLDALIESAPDGPDGQVRLTKQGVVTQRELEETQARIVREDGRAAICFPVRYPWRIKPDPARRIDGERGDPIFRSPDERGPRHTGFRVFHQPAKSEREPSAPWWED